MSSRDGMPLTRIGRSSTDRIWVRDADLVDDLIGQLTFTEMMFFQMTGKRATKAQARLLDTVLVTLMEHGITPSVIATRLIYHSSPESLQAAVAAGLLGVGTTFIGTMEGCLAILDEMIASPDGLEASADAIVARRRAAKQAVHGFGHPHHRPDDPRSPRMLAVCREEGMVGRHVDALEVLSRAVDRAYGRHLTINATGASAALLGEIGIPRAVVRGVACVSRCAGLVGHILEESEHPTARSIWEAADAAIPFDHGDVD